MIMGTKMRNLTLATGLSIVLIACSNGDDAKANQGGSEEAQASTDISPVDRKPFEKTEIASFDEPWAMTFLARWPDADHGEEGQAVARRPERHKNRNRQRTRG